MDSPPRASRRPNLRYIRNMPLLCASDSTEVEFRAQVREAMRYKAEPEPVLPDSCTMGRKTLHPGPAPRASKSQRLPALGPSATATPSAQGLPAGPALATASPGPSPGARRRELPPLRAVGGKHMAMLRDERQQVRQQRLKQQEHELLAYRQVVRKELQPRPQKEPKLAPVKSSSDKAKQWLQYKRQEAKQDSKGSSPFGVPSEGVWAKAPVAQGTIGIKQPFLPSLSGGPKDQGPGADADSVPPIEHRGSVWPPHREPRGDDSDDDASASVVLLKHASESNMKRVSAPPIGPGQVADGPTDAADGPTDAADGPTDAADGPTDAADAPTDVPTDTGDVPTDAAEVPTDTADGPTDAAEVPTDAANVPMDAAEVPTEAGTA